jgi:hypothetical protein
MYLTWKSAKTVGFGIEGAWVVAWICDVKTNPSVAEVKANVPEGTCLNNYDTCFNSMMLKAINKRR